ncbi:hypothetical protein ELQ88_17280 [Pseudomonas sp. MPC6]|nr:hypothetical protein ELQ88_17280 [Pseudomonas sp. MPC6]
MYPIPVGAGLPAKVVNDNAYGLVKRGAFESSASKPAPAGLSCLCAARSCVRCARRQVAC